ncbi:MAG: YidC/Oxa1 family membrane protein insertase [Defluviitaleaceae bacterium]|nr:YidC/Oxa1 family membrane protein insertase [Defluviitaleaceae bacterium]MCL2264107.1 YidC/Oxa1 family membrane protein insertase [Defluviitaleaceae bacterium]
MFDLFSMPRYVESPPGNIMGPIAQLFGAVINFLFNIVYSIGPAHSLGIAIILMTIIFRFLIMPLGLKSQKSMMKMRELKPELDKIKAKYGSSKDPEVMKKSQQEQQALLAKHGANPLSGCLPMLVQFPLFIGLNIVMRQAALYITTLRDMYENLASALLDVPGLVGMSDNRGIIWRLAEGYAEGFGAIVNPQWVQNRLAFENYLRETGRLYGTTFEQIRADVAAFGNDILIYGLPEHLAQILNRFTPEEWELVYRYIPAEYLPEIQNKVADISQIQNFFGVSIVDPSGMGFPGILIPILTGISMLISSWLMQQRTYDPNADERTVLTQKMMLVVMPIMMMVFTVNLVAAVGVFWITGQIFQIIQDFVLLKKSGTPIRLPFAKQPEEVVDVVPTKKKKER